MAHTFNPKRYQVSFSGILLTGLADGNDSITVERNSDAFTLVVGSDGESTRSVSPDNSGKITVRLQGTSLSNDVLSALHETDRFGNLGQAPLFVKDLSGTTTALAQAAWIVKAPSISIGKNMTNREWVFETGDLEIFTGGNL
mgnify:CR=1 FL=1